jgi:5'-3' exonuclease
MPREVTEKDFRLPEYRDAQPGDYEFRPDGKLVRKDRWETGITSIVSALGLNVREFEIDDVVATVAQLVKDARAAGIAVAAPTTKGGNVD